MHVYKVKNKINGKVYIGYDSGPTEEHRRWSGHCKEYKSLENKVLYRAMRKYGIENFQYSVIEECNTVEELKNQEVFWIAKYESTKKGYNRTFGGDGYHPSLLSAKQKVDLFKFHSNHAKKVNAERWYGPNAEENRKHLSKKLKESIDEEERRKRSKQAHRQWQNPEIKRRAIATMKERAKEPHRQKHALDNLTEINSKPRKSRRYKLTNPEGRIHITEYLSNFCKENNLRSVSALHALARNTYPYQTYKGWKCEVING